MNHIKKLSQNMIAFKTPLQKNTRLSEKYSADIFIKREDLQQVRSFKIRGAYAKLMTLNSPQDVVCASAGNHAQGFAYTCKKLNINGHIFLPSTTPLQKINRIKYFGNNSCKLYIKGDDFESCLQKAVIFSKKYNKTFIHPYNDYDVILGQATIAHEINQEIGIPDIIISTIGGGGLISGLCEYFKNTSQIYGVEALSCPSMSNSIKAGKILYTKPVNNFVDGATVPIIGDITFKICKKYVTDILTSSDGEICEKILELYENDGIIAEPAGVLPFTALDKMDIKGKKVVCILSGGNNDISRYPEIIDTYLRYKNLKHYFIIEFTQKPGELKRFIKKIMGIDDDIVRFEYIKKTNKDYGNVLIGIESKNIDTFQQNLKLHNFILIKIIEYNTISLNKEIYNSS